jgi:acetyl esterase/lipase
MMKPLVFVLCLAFVCASGGVNAQTALWQPSPGHVQVPIWPGVVPDAQQSTGAEIMTSSKSKGVVAGKPTSGVYFSVTNVTRPTMTVYAPKGRNTRVAAVVFPGGGYQILAIDLEGTEVCDWLASRGITAIILKYRVPFSGQYYDTKTDTEVTPKAPMALEDAQRTVGLVRFHAKQWHIDPSKIGVIGFSAGGDMVAEMSTDFAKRAYPPVDAADKVSCRPDFAVACYPGHLWTDYTKFELSPDIHVTSQTPPTFIVQDEDDPVDNINNSLVYYIALKNAGVPAEMHLYAHGGHAFGLRRTKFPVTAWPELMKTWLHTIGMLSN